MCFRRNILVLFLALVSCPRNAVARHPPDFIASGELSDALDYCTQSLKNLAEKIVQDSQDAVTAWKIKHRPVTAALSVPDFSAPALEAAVAWARTQNLTIIPAIERAVREKNAHATPLLLAARAPFQAHTAVGLQYSFEVENADIFTLAARAGADQSQLFLALATANTPKVGKHPVTHPNLIESAVRYLQVRLNTLPPKKVEQYVGVVKGVPTAQVVELVAHRKYQDAVIQIIKKDHNLLPYVQTEYGGRITDEAIRTKSVRLLKVMVEEEKSLTDEQLRQVLKHPASLRAIRDYLRGSDLDLAYKFTRESKNTRAFLYLTTLPQNQDELKKRVKTYYNEQMYAHAKEGLYDMEWNFEWRARAWFATRSLRKRMKELGVK